MNEESNARESQPSDMPSPSIRERLIVAPVGNQPAAILAPLQTPPLRPEREDRVILVASPDSAAYAQRIAEDLTRNGIRCEMTAASVPPSSGAFERIEQAARDRETWFLANGGPVQWTLPLVDRLRRATRDLEIVTSRDQRAFILDAVGRVRKEFTVYDLGLERLLELLGLKLGREEKSTSLFDGQGKAVLSDIVHIEERSGLLFIAIDASKWDTLDKRYRPALLAWRELQKKGLDHRRVLLLNASDGLHERARGDRFVLATKDFGLPEWKTAIGEGRAADLPEAMDMAASPGISREVPVEITSAGSWSGNPLIVVMGSQPGTTLRAVWCHEPSAVLVLFDEAQPDSCRLTHRLAVELRERAGEVVCRSYRSSDPFSSWSQRDVDVHLTPGDKLTKLQLQIWAARDPACRSRWTLEDNWSYCRDSTPHRVKEGSPVPLHVWVRFHAPTEVSIAPVDALDGVIPLADDLLHWLAGSPKSLSKLSSLWERASCGHPFLDGDDLHWPDQSSGERIIRLTDLPPGFANACRPQEGGGPNGRWFEWIVAAALKQAGVEEVALNVTYRKPDREAELFRDELDVVTRHERTYGVWSCKSDAKGINKRWLPARAQSDRLLGRQNLAVLVVPRLTDGQPPDGFCESAPGHWYRKQCGHIIDARFLTSGDIAKLACHSDYHPGSVTP